MGRYKVKVPKKSIPLTDAEKAEIIRLHDESPYLMRGIAKKVDRSEAAVRNYLASQGRAKPFNRTLREVAKTLGGGK